MQALPIVLRMDLIETVDPLQQLITLLINDKYNSQEPTSEIGQLAEKQTSWNIHRKGNPGKTQLPVWLCRYSHEQKLYLPSCSPILLTIQEILLHWHKPKSV